MIAQIEVDLLQLLFVSSKSYFYLFLTNKDHKG